MIDVARQTTPAEKVTHAALLTCQPKDDRQLGRGQWGRRRLLVTLDPWVASAHAIFWLPTKSPHRASTPPFVFFAYYRTSHNSRLRSSHVNVASYLYIGMVLVGGLPGYSCVPSHSSFARHVHVSRSDVSNVCIWIYCTYATL